MASPKDHKAAAREGTLVDGTFSTTGRATESNIRNMRSMVEESAKGAPPPLHRVPSAPVQGESSKESGPGREGLAAFAKSVRDVGFPKEGRKMGEGAPSSSQRDRPAKLALDEDPGSPSAASPSRRSPVSPSRTHKFEMFTGFDHKRYCDLAVSLHGRFPGPISPTENRPVLGQYHVNDRYVNDRYPDVELGFKPEYTKESRKGTPPEELDYMRYQDLSSSRYSFSSTASMRGEKDAWTQMMKRKGLPTAQMSEPSKYASDWRKQDKFSGHNPKYPEWDIIKHASGHNLDLGGACQFFEVGKYDVAPGEAVISPKAKDYDLMKRLNHEQEKNHGREGLTTMMKPETYIIPDRSLFRTGVQSCRRVPCPDLEKDLDRPPMYGAPKVYHDADDPEIDEAVFRSSMSFDASTADNFVIPRRDKAPKMQGSLSRTEVRGARLSESDVTFCLAQGRMVEPESLTGCSIEATGTIPSQRRMDIDTRKFETYKHRTLTKHNASAGRLFRSRSSAAPDFARSKRSGFNGKVSLARPAGWSRDRVYQALDMDAVEPEGRRRVSFVASEADAAAAAVVAEDGSAEGSIDLDVDGGHSQGPSRRASEAASAA